MDAKPGWVEKNGAALNVVMTDATQTVDVVNCTVAFNETDIYPPGLKLILR